MEEEPQGQQQQQPNKRRGFLSWFCCGAPRAPRERKAEKPPKKPKRERRPKRHPSSRRHRHRHAHGAASPALVKTGSRSELAHASLMSAGTGTRVVVCAALLVLTLFLCLAGASN